MTRDFTPLFRTAIGFDRLAQVVDGLQEAASNTFPPYNIEKTGEDTYRVSVAVAGFASLCPRRPYRRRERGSG